MTQPCSAKKARALEGLDRAITQRGLWRRWDAVLLQIAALAGPITHRPGCEQIKKPFSLCAIASSSKTLEFIL
jgi:hypothetical protein